MISSNGFMNISIDKVYDITVKEIGNYLNRFDFIYEIVAIIVVLAAIYYVCRGIFAYKSRSVESAIFIIYCAVVLINALGAGLVAFLGENTPVYIPLIASTAFLCLPAIFCLHTWSQVDYKPIKLPILMLYFAVPIILTILNAYNVFKGEYHGNVWNILCSSSFSFEGILFFIYWIAMIVKCLSLCFNVFYQMPKHMRGSTIMLIYARLVLAIVIIISAIFATEAAYLLVLFSLIFVMSMMHKGFFRANASNVIATSRQFVFSNLSTMILVLSLKGRILEWNKQPVGKSLFSFVKPKYLQPFTEFKSALLLKGDGVVSPHDENIITITIDGKELNLMITTKPITEGNREYGTLVEISEITSIYSILRVMESIAELDHMTGLYNRNAYMNVAEKYMKEEYMPLLIIVGDVNNLKTVNDTFSHLSGDRLLCCVSTIIKKHAPKESFVARIGGDEFVILVPGGFETIAIDFFNRINEEMLTVHDEEFGQPSISLGWSVVKTVNEDYNAVFALADEMMYEHKRAYKANKPLTLSGILHKKIEEEVAQQEGNEVTPQNVNEKAQQGVSESVPQNVNEVAQQGVSESVPQNVNEVAPQGVSESIPQNVNEVAPQGGYAVAPPNEFAVPPQNGYEVQPPNTFEAVSQNGYEVQPPNAFEAVPQNRYEVQPPNAFEAVPQNGFEVQPPNAVEAVPPNGYEVQSPSAFEAVPQNGYEVQPPNAFEAVPQNGYEVQPPNAFEAVPQNGYEVQPPNAFETIPQNGYEVQPPNAFEVVPQNENLGDFPIEDVTNMQNENNSMGVESLYGDNVFSDNATSNLFENQKKK